MQLNINFSLSWLNMPIKKRRSKQRNGRQNWHQINSAKLSITSLTSREKLQSRRAFYNKHHAN
jgi:hypothetical protein